MRPLLLLTVALAIVPILAQAAPSFDFAAAKKQIDAQLDRNYPELDALYKDIHAHPELAFQETRTAALLATRMRKLGFTVTEQEKTEIKVKASSEQETACAIWRL